MNPGHEYCSTPPPRVQCIVIDQQGHGAWRLTNRRKGELPRNDHRWQQTCSRRPSESAVVMSWSLSPAGIDTGCATSGHSRTAFFRLYVLGTVEAPWRFEKLCWHRVHGAANNEAKAINTRMNCIQNADSCKQTSFISRSSTPSSMNDRNGESSICLQSHASQVCLM
jgi:hypothetical protein